MTASYHNPRPSLTIECTGSRNLGRCYNAANYRITTTSRLTKAGLKALRDGGFLGTGQEFSIKIHGGRVLGGFFHGVDGTEEPTGHDTVPCLEDDGKPAVNPYSQQPYPDTQMPFFVYECEDRCDSGD